MSTFKPLLAVQAELDKIDFSKGLVASPKLDGIRCIIINSVAMSRSLKPIPNKHIQYLLGRPELNGLDGEIIFGEPTSPSCYRDTNSACMSIEGEPAITFYVFDHIGQPEAEYCRRLIATQETALRDTLGCVKVLPQVGVNDLDELKVLELAWLDEGYEGLMLRTLQGDNSRYKFGRATAKSQTLLKVKRMTSDEAVILDVIELQHNLNEAVTNELGYTERSSRQANKVAGGTMGALLVRCLRTSVEFQLGTGFTVEERLWFWGNSETVKGRIVTFDHFSVGRKDLPRHPSYKGFRAKEDM